MPRGNIALSSARAGDGRWQAFSPLAFDAAQDSGAAFITRTPAHESGPAPFIRPHGIYVARKNEFELSAPTYLDASGVAALYFLTLPLKEHGWSITRTKIQKLRSEPDCNIWRLRRMT